VILDPNAVIGVGGLKPLSNSGRDSTSPANAGSADGSVSGLSRWKVPLVRAGGIIGAAALAALGSQFAGTIISRLQALAPGQELEVRVVPDGQFVAGTAVEPFVLVPFSRGVTPMDLTQADLSQLRGSSLKQLPRLGGIPASPRVLHLELRSSNGSKVLIRDIRAELVEQRPSPPGWFLTSAGCGVEEVRTAVLDLDAPGSRVRLWLPESGEAPPSSRSLLSVTGEDVEILEVHASTLARDLLWRLRFYYSSPAGEGVLVVDNRGRPFQTAGVRGQQAWRLESSAEGMLKPVRYPQWDQQIRVC